MLDAVRGPTLIAATLATGLLAGLFFAFAVAVMPALTRVDDRTFIDTMQRVNEAVLNPWFFLAFLGAPLLTAVTAVLQFRDGGRAALPWTLAGLVLHGIALAVTIGVNVPLNDALAAAGPPARIADPAQVRAQFEAGWVRWNLVRSLTTAAAFGCLTWAVAVHG